MNRTFGPYRRRAYPQQREASADLRRHVHDLLAEAYGVVPPSPTWVDHAHLRRGPVQKCTCRDSLTPRDTPDADGRLTWPRLFLMGLAIIVCFST